MKKIIALCVCLTIALSSFMSITSFAFENVKTIFVSLDGSDETGDGSIQNPYKTPEKARDEVRKITEAERKNLSGITVYFIITTIILSKIA